MHGEELVVGLVGDEIAGRRRQVEPDEHGERAADEEEHRRGRQVQQRDALVVARQQPRFDAVTVVQVVMRGNQESRHGYLAPVVAGSDFTCSTSWSSPSSFTTPWNVGMIG